MQCVIVVMTMKTNDERTEGKSLAEQLGSWGPRNGKDTRPGMDKSCMAACKGRAITSTDSLVMNPASAHSCYGKAREKQKVIETERRKHPPGS